MTGPASVRDLTAGDGTPLRYRAWEPHEAAGAVLLVHGLGDHSGRYAAVAEELTRRSISLFAPDLRGHGLSGGQRGHVRRFADYLEDLDLVVEAIRARIRDRPLILLGHSMGGLVALRYAETRPGAGLSGLALSAPQLRIANPPPPWLRRLAAALGTILPALPFPNGIDAEDLSHDAAEVEAYRSDPLVHDRVTPRWFEEAQTAMRAAMDEISAVSAPAALVMIPGADRVVQPSATRDMAARLADVIPVEVREYPAMYHEPFHEADRAVPIRDLVDWVLPRIA